MCQISRKRKAPFKTFARRRSISFCPTVVVVREVIDECPEKSELWYNRSDLRNFKSMASEEAKIYRLLSSAAVGSSPQMSSLVLPYKDCGVHKKMNHLLKVQAVLDESSESQIRPQFRGLEGAIFAERQRNKTIATNAVFEFQRRANVLVDEAHGDGASEEVINSMRSMYAEQLSNTCARLSQWSKDEALASAHLDAKGVYSIPVMLHPEAMETAERKATREVNESLEAKEAAPVHCSKEMKSEVPQLDEKDSCAAQSYSVEGDDDVEGIAPTFHASTA